MADAKSRFKRPETPASPSLNPEAERFVRGTEQPLDVVRIESASRPEAAHQVETAPAKEDPNKRLTIDIPESLHTRVKMGCAAQGTTIADVVRAFLERKFPEPKGQQP